MKAFGCTKNVYEKEKMVQLVAIVTVSDAGGVFIYTGSTPIAPTAAVEWRLRSLSTEGFFAAAACCAKTVQSKQYDYSTLIEHAFKQLLEDERRQ